MSEKPQPPHQSSLNADAGNATGTVASGNTHSGVFGLFSRVNRFHFFVLITWQFGIFFATQMLFPIFSNYIPRWRCTRPGSDPLFAKNCTLWEECGGNGREWIEFENYFFASSALEFDWVCGARAYMRTLYSQLQFVGVLIGTLLWGSLSDRVGRKPVALVVLTLGITANLVSGLVPSWQLLFAARFCIGVCIGGTVVVVCTFVMEMLLPEQRMALRAFFNWGTARLFVTGICYAFPDWRSASVACAACAVPVILIVAFVFPESPTWLHSKNKLEQMRASERHIARIAGTKYEEVRHDPIVKKQSFIDLVRDRALLKRVFVLWVMWFVASICGYAIDLHSSNIVGNLFLNQALFSILIAVSKVFLVVFDTHSPSFSRRNLHQYAQFVVIICFLALTVITLLKQQGVYILVINVIGTVFIEYTWDACYLCGVESVPTEMRATSLGSCSFVARIGAVLAPALAFLNSVWPPSAYLAVVVLGTINLLISYNFMVETKGIDLDCVRIHDDSGEPIAERHVLEEGGKKAEAERMLVPEMESEVTPEAAVADAVDDRKRDENNWTIVEDAPDEVVAEDGKVAKR